MELKMRINKTILSAESLGVFDVSDESKVRVVVEDASLANEITISGRIKGASSFTLLKTLSGSTSEVVNVFTYEEIEVVCTNFGSTSNSVKVIASSFNEAGGSAIESIGVPSGENLSDIENLTLISSDNSVNIVGDNLTKTINLTTTGSSAVYIPSDSSDWSPEPTTISEGLDQLADRLESVESSLGQPEGIATLDSSGKVPASQLPSYVDDVLEVADFDSLPLEGETGKIYVTLDTNKTYRWTGSIYIEISATPENLAVNFDALTSWTLVEDEYILEIPASTHLKGINPQIQVYESESSEFVNVIVYISMNELGDIFLKVTQTPDTRFSGKLIIS
jgi:hypothetical protein